MNYCHGCSYETRSSYTSQNSDTNKAKLKKKRATLAAIVHMRSIISLNSEQFFRQTKFTPDKTCKPVSGTVKEGGQMLFKFLNAEALHRYSFHYIEEHYCTSFGNKQTPVNANMS